jgi:hypothetical protein
VALEATTGWRFVAEELRAMGGGVRLAQHRVDVIMKCEGWPCGPSREWSKVEHRRRI